MSSSTTLGTRLFQDMPQPNVASMNGNDMTEADGDTFNIV